MGLNIFKLVKHVLARIELIVWQENRVTSWPCDKMQVWRDDHVMSWPCDKMQVWQDDCVTSWLCDELTGSSEYKCFVLLPS